jgi:Cu/Ag efflux pump CusA
MDASIEVRSAVVYATFAVILVFFPVLSMSGLAGRIFGPLGIAYIWAILASLVVALTVTPALCFFLLANRPLPPQEPPAVHWLRERYQELLIRIERIPRLVMVAVGFLVAIGIGALFLLNESFLPQLREGNITVHMTALPGTSLQESLRLGNRITEPLLRIPSLQSVAQRAGRAELGTDIMGTHESEIDINLQARNGKQVRRAQAGIQEVIAQFPGPILTSNSFLTERINETLSGYRTSVVVNVYGNDLDQLDQEAGQIAQVLSSVRGGARFRFSLLPGCRRLWCV